MWSKSSARALFLAVALLLVVRSRAFAYIDPGTGMSFVSGIGAFLAAIVAVAAGAIAVTFKRWMAFLTSFFKRRSGEDRHSR